MSQRPFSRFLWERGDALGAVRDRHVPANTTELIARLEKLGGASRVPIDALLFGDRRKSKQEVSPKWCPRCFSFLVRHQPSKVALLTCPRIEHEKRVTIDYKGYQRHPHQPMGYEWGI